MRYTVEYLRKRKYLSLVILPEGTRTRTGLLGKFKRGGFLIAIETGIPIVPITVNGLFDFQQKGGFLLNPGRVEVVFHEPVETKGMTKNDASTLREKVRKFIRSMHAMEIAASK